MNLIFEKVNDTTLRIDAPYNEVYEHIKSCMLSKGGKIKKDDQSTGVIEFSWRYGLNPFGLRVTVQFRTIEDSTIEINFKGGFKDSLDTTGAGKKKAYEIINEVMSCGSVEKESANKPDMPPRIGDESTLNRGKSKVIAGILAILLGGLGIHKFYIGNWGLGIIFLVSAFIFPGLAAVIGFIEGIRYLLLSENDFNEKYNYCEITPFEVKW